MTDTDTSRREALTRFDFDDAPDLADTRMMSMPTPSEPSPPVETMLEWAHGIEILEFRNATSFDMQITASPARWEKIVEGVREHAAGWEAAPEHHRV